MIEDKAITDLEFQHQQMLSIFDSIDAPSYVCDPNTYEVLYINKAIRQEFGDIVGQKCYQVFQGLDSPCPFCTNNIIFSGKAGQPYIWEFQNRKNHRWYHCIDKAIHWPDGRLVRYEMAIDITERKEAEKNLGLLNQELIRSSQRLKQLVLRDSQTGLYNYRYLQEVIEAEFYRARRYAHPLSVIMLDIDYFKSINDVYGNHFGDLVLKQLARRLKRMMRRYDIIIRSGGEEFIVISPGTDKSQILTLARRLLDAINLYNFGDKKHTVKLKLSLAVASYPEDKIIKGIDLTNLTSTILNKAKEYGGNNVYSSEDIENKKTSPREKNGEASNVKFLKRKIDRLTKRANQSLMEAIFAFARTIKLKDNYTGDHVEKTVQYVTEIARELNLPEKDIEHIRQAAILHDLGKIGISDRILLKKSKLTKKEFAVITKHPQIGVDIIRPIQFLHDIIPLIFYHHERWDGKGYPAGLKGEEIPVGARIIAIADVYEALSSDRPYRKAYHKDKVIKIIENDAGIKFDPNIARVFLRILQQEK